MNKLLLANNDFGYFVEDILGLDYSPHHKEIANIMMNSAKGEIVASRGHGKTELAIAYILWYIIFNKNKEVVIISATVGQAYRVLERIKMYIDENEFLKMLNPDYVGSLEWDEWKKTWSKSEIRVSTGCKVMCRPFNSSIRGNHVDLCICDDVLRNDDGRASISMDTAKKIYVEDVRPIVVQKNGRIILIGTPMQRNDLLWVIKDMGEYDVVEIPCVKMDDEGEWVEPVWKFRYTLENEEGKTDLRSLKKEMNAVRLYSFEKEYMLTPISAGTSVFSSEVIEKQSRDIPEIHKPRDGCNYYCGVDVAMSESSSADYTVIMILEEDENGNVRIVKYDRFSGKGSTQILQQIQFWDKIFDFVYIVIEQQGLSYGMIRQANNEYYFDEVRNEIMGKVEGFKTSGINKERLISQLVSGMSNGRLFVPVSDDLLYDEMISFSVVKNRNGKDKLEGKGAHDDIIMALAMAWECFLKYGGRRVSFEAV